MKHTPSTGRPTSHMCMCFAEELGEINFVCVWGKAQICQDSSKTPPCHASPPGLALEKCLQAKSPELVFVNVVIDTYTMGTWEV